MTAAVRTLILAGSFSEAAKYARGKQLRSYRYAVNAAAVGSYQATDIVELPGYANRRDKFAFQSAIRNLLRRGVEVRKDSYTPPPPPPAPQYGDVEYVADPLLGDVPTPDVLREVGATEAEVKLLTDIAPAAEKIAQAIQDVASLTKDDFVESAPKRRGRPPGSKNKPRITPGPPATPADLAEAKRVIGRVNDVEDLFED